MKYRAESTGIEIDMEYLDASEAEVRKQLDDYFEGERTEFELGVTFPESFVGEVMQAVSEIPFGETRTYSDIAEKISSAAVAVGQALGRNPVPVIVPCHRVLGKNSMGGYKYPGLKQKLLEIEGVQLDRRPGPGI